MRAMSQGERTSQYDFIVCGSTGAESIDEVGAEWSLRGFRAGRAPGEPARSQWPGAPGAATRTGRVAWPVGVGESATQLATARGWLVQTMDLPSTADRGGPRGDLYDDAAAVRQRIEGIEGSVVVVAHSYGAVPATQGAADLPNVRHIVYVCGFVLDVGELLLGLLGTEPDWWVVDGDIVTVDNPRAAFFHDVGREDVERAIARMKPFNRVAATQALTSAACIVFHRRTSSATTTPKSAQVSGCLPREQPRSVAYRRATRPCCLCLPN